MEVKPAYATFEQSKLLKEKGFDVICDSVYVNDWALEGIDKDSGVYKKVTSEPQRFGKSVYNFTNNDKQKNYNAKPEQWKVVEWLRFKHNILIFPFIQLEHLDENYEEKTMLEYVYFIFDLKSMVKNKENVLPKLGEGTDNFYLKNPENKKDFFTSPQEAYCAAFDYVLKELI